MDAGAEARDAVLALIVALIAKRTIDAPSSSATGAPGSNATVPQREPLPLQCRARADAARQTTHYWDAGVYRDRDTQRSPGRPS